jgi:flagellar biosynthesis/type III secretory pathway M-ring protein FliF/YscJ
MAFDQNKRIFGFYTQTGEYDTKDNTNKENGQSLALSWILVIILSIILIGLGIAFYKLLPYIKRRKRANELEDEYDYPNTEAPNNDQKNEEKNDIKALLIN